MKNILSTTEGQKGANREGQRGKGQECNNILNGFSFHPLERAVDFFEGRRVDIRIFKPGGCIK